MSRIKMIIILATPYKGKCMICGQWITGHCTIQRHFVVYCDHCVVSWYGEPPPILVVGVVHTYMKDNEISLKSVVEPWMLEEMKKRVDNS